MKTRGFGFISKIEPKKQIVIGSILSYILLILDFAVALFLPRWINSVVGQDNYGVYTLTTSLVSMFLLDFGLGAASSKFLSKLVVGEDLEGEKNLLGIIYKIYFFIDSILLVIFTIIFLLLDKIYVGLTPEQLKTLKIIFPIVAVYNLINFPFLSLEGSFVSHEQFIALKLFNLLNKILYVALISTFLALKLNVVYISLAAVISGIVILICKYLYCKFYCNFSPHWRFWDKKLALKVFNFSLWITIATIANKLISSLMPSILGIVSDANNISIYGYAYALECNAFSLTIVLSSMMIPNLTKLMKENDNTEKIDNLAIKVGRLQMLIISLLFFGFVSFGKEFLIMLMGNSYSDAYYCFLLLFIPNMINGALAICERVSHVQNTVKYIGIIKIIASVLTVGIAFLLGKHMGAIGVSISYCAIQLIGSFAIIIFVFWKKQHMNMKRIIIKIFIPILLPCLIPTLLTFLLKYFISFTNIYLFIIGVFTFTFIFIILYYFLALSRRERFNLHQTINQKRISRNPTTTGNIIIGGSKIKINKDKLIFISAPSKFEYLKIKLKKYGKSDSKNNKNYLFCYLLNDSDIVNPHSSVLICLEKYFLNIDKNIKYNKIIVLRNHEKN